MEYAFLQWLIGDILIPGVTIGISLIIGFFTGRFYENRRLAKLNKNAYKNTVLNNKSDFNKR
ncbi:MAG: hypothetical protein ACYCWE_10990 [Eubacteriales bacterium]